MVKKIATKEEFDEIINGSGDKLVVVDFTASWCGPCKMIAPEFQRMSETYTEVIFLKVDVDECKAVAAAQKISAMPTFKFFKNGTLYDAFKGASVAKLEAGVKKYSAEDATPNQDVESGDSSCVVL